MKMMIFCLLFLGFFLLFYRLHSLSFVSRVLKRTKDGINIATRNRLLENRTEMERIREQEGFWYRLERELDYTGLKRKYPKMNAEWYLTFQIMLFCLGTLFVLPGRNLLLLAGCWVGMIVAKKLLVAFAKMRELRSVNDNLLKLLDFLGNYSITSGELSSVFLQVGKFVDEPLSTALEQCSYEAQTTGDVGAAMLSMAEKIEHPKFKELVQNLEIAGRYCADLTIMVNSNRRSMRDYLRVQRERKGMLREAAINMGLLLLLSVFSMATVDRLITTSVWEILFMSWPGRGALAVILFIFFLFGNQVLDINK